MVLAVTDLAYISQPLYSEGKQHLSKHEELKILYAQVHENVKTARLYNMLSELPWIFSTMYQVSAQSLFINTKKHKKNLSVFPHA